MTCTMTTTRKLSEKYNQNVCIQFADPVVGGATAFEDMLAIANALKDADPEGVFANDVVIKSYSDVGGSAQTNLGNNYEANFLVRYNDPDFAQVYNFSCKGLKTELVEDILRTLSEFGSIIAVDDYYITSAIVTLV